MTMNDGLPSEGDFDQQAASNDVADLNCLIQFLARRDLADLTSQQLLARRGVDQADRLILMGGITTPDFAERVATAFHRGFARGLLVVGGVGHSTQNLRNSVAAHPRISRTWPMGRTIPVNTGRRWWHTQRG